jgi:hypothetical protein
MQNQKTERRIFVERRSFDKDSMMTMLDSSPSRPRGTTMHGMDGDGGFIAGDFKSQVHDFNF